MKRIVFASVVTLCLVATALWQPWAGEDVVSETSVSVVVPGAGGSVQGYRATIDPATGKLSQEPQAVDVSNLPESLRNALSTSSQGLVERPSPVAGGGVMVDLQGRFQSTSVARVHEDGTVEAPCLTNEDALEAFVSGSSSADGEE